MCLSLTIVRYSHVENLIRWITFNSPSKEPKKLGICERWCVRKSKYSAVKIVTFILDIPHVYIYNNISTRLRKWRCMPIGLCLVVYFFFFCSFVRLLLMARNVVHPKSTYTQTQTHTVGEWIQPSVWLKSGSESGSGSHFLSVRRFGCSVLHAVHSPNSERMCIRGLLYEQITHTANSTWWMRHHHCRRRRRHRRCC